MLNTFGTSGLVALVINNSPDERQEATEFMGRMPYTFVNVQSDVKFWTSFSKASDAGPVDTILLGRDGRVLYGRPPNSVAATQRFSHALKLLLAHEARAAVGRCESGARLKVGAAR